MAKRKATIGQRRATIQIVSMGTDAYGSFSGEDDYTLEHTLRARIRPMEGVDSKEGRAQQYFEYTHIFITRWHSGLADVDSTKFVIHENKRYKIKSVLRIGQTVDDPKLRDLMLETTFDSDIGAFTNPSPESI